MDGRQRFRVDRLRAVTGAIFAACGLRADHAATVTDVLLHAELRGHASHGLMRVPIYTDRLRRGIVNPAPRIRIERPAPAVLHVDADNGPGAIGSLAALEAAIEAARGVGAAVAIVAHSNHNGAGSYYVEKAAAAGCLAIGMTNAPPSMAVHGGKSSAIGTNPIAFAAPVAGGGPLVADLATSVVARGKIIDRARRSEAIPEGWALDAAGRPTTSAIAAEQGVILPMAGPKGSALAIMVEALTGVLAGGRFGASIGSLYADFDRSQDLAHFFLVIALEAADPAGGFAGRLAALLGELKGGPVADGVAAIRMPGEPTAEKAQLLESGEIRLAANVANDLVRTAQALGVDAEGLARGAEP